MYKMKRMIWLLLPMVMFSCASRQQNEGEEPKHYELLTITTGDHELSTEYAASLKGQQDIRIIPRIEGYLQGIYVKEGEQVKEGQLLFRVDAATYRAAVETANANVQQMTAALEKAQLEYEGKQKLRAKNVISDYELASSKSDLAVAKANLAAAQAALTSTRNDLSYTELRSPSDGIVGRIRYRKGDFVSPNLQEGLTIVADNRHIRAYFSMSETVLMDYLSEHKTMEAAVNQMPEVRLLLPNGQFYGQTGRVESISGIVDESTGAVSVCALFDNRDGILLSGGTGKIVMPAVRKNAIVIPQEATYEIQDKVYVIKVVDGKTVSTIIKVEPQNDGKEYVVVNGLKEGDVIIAKGAGFVQEGERVIVNR
ncbi:MAG: efflux RND transporter periplasmic adaptor subunit [Bacteroidales bacterium]|nr:efflux RND transporter periplasmic adaptor subunit [Bacteroidales bacterium]